MAHLTLCVFNIGPSQFQPDCVRRSQASPVHPGQANLSGCWLDEPTENVVIAHRFPIFHRLKYQVVGALGFDDAVLADCVRKVRKIMRVPISLETPIGEEGDSPLSDLIEDRAQISPAEAVMSANVQERTAQVLRTLSPREEKIIRMRFGIEDGSEHTLEEVGRAFSVTRERIRQIEAKALRKLRHPSRSRELKSFFHDPRE